MGVTHEELLSAFDAKNLNQCHPGTAGKYDLFDIPEALATAAHLRRYVIPRRDVVVLCGKAVARCFGMEAMEVGRIGRATVYALPHPAGTSMWWNDLDNRARGARLAREAWEAAR
jgi:hypothetical protein